MKTSFIFCTITAGMALLLSSCVIQTPAHRDTSVINYRSKDLNYQDFRKGKLTVLPIVTEDNSNIQLKEMAGDALCNSLRKDFPEQTIISSGESGKIINNANLFGRILNRRYKISGLLNKAT